jgi:hypothetical protein
MANTAVLDPAADYYSKYKKEVPDYQKYLEMVKSGKVKIPGVPYAVDTDKTPITSSLPTLTKQAETSPAPAMPGITQATAPASVASASTTPELYSPAYYEAIKSNILEQATTPEAKTRSEQLRGKLAGMGVLSGSAYDVAQSQYLSGLESEANRAVTEAKLKGAEYMSPEAVREREIADLEKQISILQPLATSTGATQQAKDLYNQAIQRYLGAVGQGQAGIGQIPPTTSVPPSSEGFLPSTSTEALQAQIRGLEGKGGKTEADYTQLNKLANQLYGTANQTYYTPTAKEKEQTIYETKADELSRAEADFTAVGPGTAASNLKEFKSQLDMLGRLPGDPGKAARLIFDDKWTQFKSDAVAIDAQTASPAVIDRFLKMLNAAKAGDMKTFIGA